MSIKAATVNKEYHASGIQYALEKLNLEGAGDRIRRKMIEVAIDRCYDESKAEAPVLTGALRDSIYKDVMHGRYLIRGKVAIPTSIPYRFPVLFGDKNHRPNRFMETALDHAIAYLLEHFPQIVKKSFGEARGKQ